MNNFGCKDVSEANLLIMGIISLGVSTIDLTFQKKSFYSNNFAVHIGVMSKLMLVDTLVGKANLRTHRKRSAD